MAYKKTRINLIAPDISTEATLTYTSEYGYAGCEGFVQSGILQIGDTKKSVQVKTFFKETCDDRGTCYSQDPDKKACESYYALCGLNKWGFKVLPFYALGASDTETDVLVMHDLTEQGKKEVYDEKYLHRRKSDFEKLKKSPNWNDIEFEVFKMETQKCVHNISLGYGVSNMITRDPISGELDIFITDVGEYMENLRSPGKVQDYLKRKDFIPHEVLSLFQRIAGDRHLAVDFYQKFKELYPRRFEFMNLIRAATTSLAFSDCFGGWASEAEWSRKRFARNRLSDKFMKIKSHLSSNIEVYKSLTNEDVFDWSSESRKRFSPESRDNLNLIRGLDFAYQGSVDSDLSHINSVEENDRLSQRKPIRFINGLPALRFLDDDPLRNPNVKFFLTCKNINGDNSLAFELETDWKTAYNYNLVYGNKLVFGPEHIKGLFRQEFTSDYNIKRTRIKFDRSKLKLVRSHIESTPGVYYVYGDKIIHQQLFYTQEELNSACITEF